MRGQMTDEVIDATFEEDVLEEHPEGVPVLADLRPIERVPAKLPAVQAAAAAATGFVAGAATIALVRRHQARRLARTQRGVVQNGRRGVAQPVGRRGAVEMLPIVGSRTFLVDVHLIAKGSGQD